MVVTQISDKAKVMWNVTMAFGSTRESDVGAT
jgi:hypothetical protein